MALLYSGSVSEGVIQQFSMPSNFTNSATIFVQVNNVQENNIRLIGSLYFYKLFTNSEFSQYFGVVQADVRQPRTAVRIGFAANQTDIVRFIPLYDFSSVGIWVNNATY